MATTGLRNEGYRYRDLESGVWLSRDPAGFVDGPNLYAYCTQNPWSAFDPDGLEKRHKDNPSNEDIGVAIDSLRKQGDQQAAAHKAQLAKQCSRCHPVGENDIGESARGSYAKARFLERILKVRGKTGEDGYGEMQAGLELSKEFGNEVSYTHREFFRGESGFMTSSRQRETFGWITGLAQASINSSVMFALSGGAASPAPHQAANGTAGVWSSIRGTQPRYPGTVIPKSFEIGTKNGRIWVHGNATEHMAEYATGLLNKGVLPSTVRLQTQSQLTSLQSALNAATRGGIPSTRTFLEVGGWELGFGNQQAGRLPVLIHALMK